MQCVTQIQNFDKNRSLQLFKKRKVGDVFIGMDVRKREAKLKNVRITPQNICNQNTITAFSKPQYENWIFWHRL